MGLQLGLDLLRPEQDSQAGESSRDGGGGGAEDRRPEEGGDLKLRDRHAHIHRNTEMDRQTYPRMHVISPL